MKARAMVGRGEEGPLCDSGSRLLLGGRQGESNARMINGMENKQNIYIYIRNPELRSWCIPPQFPWWRRRELSLPAAPVATPAAQAEKQTKAATYTQTHTMSHRISFRSDQIRSDLI